MLGASRLKLLDGGFQLSEPDVAPASNRGLKNKPNQFG